MKSVFNRTAHRRKDWCAFLPVFFVFIFTLCACNTLADQPQSSGKLKVVATTTIVGDVVAQVGGDRIDVNVVLPLGADPHSFDPTPQDIAKVAEADLVFANGAELEAFLEKLIESADASARVVDLSTGIDLIAMDADQAQAEDERDHGGLDPHTWTDPKNVAIWVETIATELNAADPKNAAVYAAQAEAYQSDLEALDTWIAAQVAQIPPEKRKIVSDHTQWSYFAATYGFEQVGALIPGFSTLAEPSAKELAAIEDAIISMGVEAIFVGHSINPNLAERVAADTGTRLVTIYTGSLSAAGEGAATYIEYMRYNTSAFVEALR